ncbi:hypothetical protein M409DRAFT_57327 [Zasmidium cellare ATCC 36951]|uniref:Uncharacterized protein n=1 Tax=Zasmidium cellare ATCC 36951 TaxID=1080233 RepID=A0A6A6CB06_ZASCE|nr:uncharacterized protein M409DRAFT_57327 [Zasmidium cellare ATCC 36951]KAF2163418.1 hypothetical protein M409DRAFT_57327 [Zasmidium cellare ATCC 36951]
MSTSTFTTAVLGLLAAFPASYGVTVPGLPGYCDPGSPADANNLQWYDVTSDCSNAGIPGYCCVTFVGNSQCEPDFSSETTSTVSDLLNAINQQLGKSGQFDSSKVGHWFATYSLFADKPESAPAIEQIWDHAIDEFIANATQKTNLGPVSSVWLYAGGSQGPTRIEVDYNC